MTLNRGDLAPDFTAETADGEIRVFWTPAVDARFGGHGGLKAGLVLHGSEPDEHLTVSADGTLVAFERPGFVCR
jgi:hypothetical protein